MIMQVVLNKSGPKASTEAFPQLAYFPKQPMFLIDIS